MPIRITSIDPHRPAGNDFPTVGEVIAKLSLMPQDAPVGFSGHFGELHPFEINSVYATTRDRIACMWTGAETHPFTAVVMSFPDIGPEPD